MIRVFVRRVPKSCPVGMTEHELEHRTAWDLLCKVLFQEYGLSITEQDCLRTSLGKPYLSGGGVEFSLTHTPYLVAVAVGETPVGIDAEPQDRRISAALRARHLDDCPPELAVTAWTAKEAYGKLLGEGVFASKETGGPAPNFQTLFAYSHVITVCSFGEEIAKDVISN